MELLLLAYEKQGERNQLQPWSRIRKFNALDAGFAVRVRYFFASPRVRTNGGNSCPAKAYLYLCP